MVCTKWANSSGSPSRLGKRTLKASSVLTGSGRLARRGVLNSPREGRGGEGRGGEGRGGEGRGGEGRGGEGRGGEGRGGGGGGGGGGEE